MIPEIQTFILAMTPIGELRAAIPFALEYHQINWVLAYFIAVVGNMVPVVFIFAFLDPVVKFLTEKSKFFDKLFSFLFEKTIGDNEGRIKKSGYLALVGFTAIPLPISGAWTASLVAYLFKMNYKKAFLAILVGVLIAGGVVTVLIEVGDRAAGFSGLQLFGGFVIFGLLLFYLLKIKK